MRQRIFLPLFGVLIATGILASTVVAADNEAPINRRWMNRPWEVQRFVMVTEKWDIHREGAVRRNTKHEVDRRGYSDDLEWEAVFDPKYPITLTDSLLGVPLSVAIIEFDRDGRVLTPNAEARPLRGRLTQMNTLVLSTGDTKQDDQYDLAYWLLGLGDISTHWAPAFCTGNQLPNWAGIPDENYLYGREFKAHPRVATFGCREWAYQLYDKERPYIDVTSYVPKDESRPHGSYIWEFIGWFRFDEHKPVIGKDEDKWYCLLDCPDGEQPGLIPDIRAWAKRHGWAIPKRPTKSPTFPDPPSKSGTYPR